MAALADFKLTTGDVAERLGVSQSTVIRWADDPNGLPSLRLPKGWRRFRESDVEAYEQKLLATRENGDTAA